MSVCLSGTPWYCGKSMPAIDHEIFTDEIATGLWIIIIINEIYRAQNSQGSNFQFSSVTKFLFHAVL